MTGMTALGSGYSFQLDVYYEAVKWAEDYFEVGCLGAGKGSNSETGKRPFSDFFIAKKNRLLLVL